MKLLPHRYPFLLRRPHQRHGSATRAAVGIKNVTINEPFFQGHFPQFPGHAGRAHHRGPGADGGRAVRAQPRRRLQAADRLFHGDRQGEVPQAGACRATSCTIMCSKIRSRGRAWRFYGEAKVDGQVVAEAEISAMIVDADAQACQKNADRTIHPTAIVEDGRPARRRRADRPVLPWSAATSTLGDGCELLSHVVVAGRTTIGARHADLSLRLDRPSAAGPQVQGRAVDADDRRRLPDPRRRHDEPRHRGRRHGDDGRRPLRLPRQLPRRPRLPRRQQRHLLQQRHAGRPLHASATSPSSAAARRSSSSRASARTAFLGGMSGLENDLIPYGMALGNRAYLSGLNIVGLQRRGFSRERHPQPAPRLSAAVRRRGHAAGAASTTWRPSSPTIRSCRRSSPSSAPAASARCARRATGMTADGRADGLASRDRLASWPAVACCRARSPSARRRAGAACTSSASRARPSAASSAFRTPGSTGAASAA